MSQEEQRYVRERFTSDEELSLYDMLFRDDLSKTDIKKLKEVAASLLQKIKMKIAEFDHWTDKQEIEAAIDNLIRDTLWQNCLSVTMRLASLCIVSRFTNMCIRDIEQLLNKGGE